MSVQIYSYGGCIRLVTDSSVLLLAKAQVKSIEAVRDDSVKISLGEGPLNEIIIKLSDVTMPSGLVDIAALRDAIAHMLDHANLFEDEALIKLQAQIDQLIEIKQLCNLWQGSFQIDLNFQQLQVNALVAINNRLLESKENDERLISQAHDQVNALVAINSRLLELKENDEKLISQAHDQFTESKSQSLQLTSLGNGLETLKAAIQNSLSIQEGQAAELGNIESQIDISNSLLKALQTLMGTNLNNQNTQTGILNELKAILSNVLAISEASQNEMAANNAILMDMRGQNTNMLTKQDTQISLLTAIKDK
jgi:hypothetical protein